MKRILTYGLLVLNLLSFLSLGPCKNKEGQPIRGDDIYVSGNITTENRTSTARGTTVTAAKDEWRPASLFPAIDTGLENLFSVLPHYGYTQANTHPYYWVMLLPDEIRGKCINPSFLMAGDGSPWDGTDFDKDPRPYWVILCVAGATPGAPYMVVVNHEATLLIVVRYEGEHIVLQINNPIRFAETIGIHAHPLLPGPDGQLSKVQAVVHSAEDVLDKKVKVRNGEFVAWSGVLPKGVELKVDDRVVAKEGDKFCVLLTK